MLISPWHRLTPAGAGMVRLDRVWVSYDIITDLYVMCSKQMERLMFVWFMTMMTHDPCSSWHGINSLGMMTGAVMIAVMTGAGMTGGTTGGMTRRDDRPEGWSGAHGMVGWWHLSCRSGQGPFHHISPESSFDDLHTFLGILNTFHGVDTTAKTFRSFTFGPFEYMGSRAC